MGLADFFLRVRRCTGLLKQSTNFSCRLPASPSTTKAGGPGSFG
jgi:hypothetical protein